MQKLTDKAVRALPVPNKGQRIYWDSEAPGLGIRITPGGTRSFILDYRANGRQRRYTIGAFPDWTVSEARDEARKLRRDIDLGDDPMGNRHTEREAPTVAALAQRYITDHLPRKRPGSQANDRAMLEQLILPKLAKRKLSAVTHADIEALHREVSKRAPYRANRMAALLSKMFNLAVKWGMTDTNPVKGLEKNPEEKREQYLAPEELARLTEALARHPNQQSANIVRLLILTGARKGEVLAMRWQDLDCEAGTWTKPSAHTKQKKKHHIPLSAPAVELLASIRRNPESPHVFPGERPGEHQQDIRRFWTTVCKWAGVTNVRPHDLRHTYASYLASTGQSLPVIGALLGHTQPGTTARYAHLLLDPLKQATERVGAMVTAPNKAAVVKLRKGRTS
jgi:integrase